MDASRLLSVVVDIEREFKNGLSQLLKELIQQYTVARDSPTQDNSAAIQKTLGAISEYAEQGAFNLYPPSKIGVLKAIGGTHRVGIGLRDNLLGILSVAGHTTAGIVVGLNQLQTDLESFRKACAQTRSGLESLGIQPHVIPEDQFEVGVLIPEGLVDQKLGGLAKELETWNKILRGFMEVAGDEEREVTVAALSSGSYEAYVPLGLVAAGLVAKTIEKVLDWYMKVLEIRKLREELASRGAPVAEAHSIRKHERELLEQGIRGLAEQLVKETHPRVEVGRRRELETQLTISIRQIARFVDQGGTVEVDAAPPAEPDEPTLPEDDSDKEAKSNYDRLSKEYERLMSQMAKVSAIIAEGGSLRKLPERSEPILQLTDGEAGDEQKDLEKTPKKKSL